jgi:DNA modification methylase
MRRERGKSMHRKRKRTSVTAASALQIVVRPVSTLKFNASNPRLHGRRQIRQIAKSIQTFGFNVPILVDSDLNIIAGEGRARAAKDVGLSEVPTISLDHLTDAQIRAFVIADNRLAENSTWDETLLAEQLKFLSGLDLDFSLEATGFDIGEIDFRIEHLSKTEPEDQSDPGVPPIGPAVTRSGDLWELGPHRVYCGSALDSESFASLMAGKKAQAIFTDPPYNVPISGHVSGLGANRHREFAMASGEMSPGEFTKFLTTSFTLLVRNSIPGALHFVAMDWRHIGEIVAATQDIYTLQNICVWVKNNAGMGSLYRSQHEFIFVFKAGRGSHRNNVQLGRYGRSRTNIWSYPGANTFGPASEEGPLSPHHPTVKPIRLVADAILDCTARGDVVLDSFLGSGTTVIAAERTGRRCYGIEIDPLYVDFIVRRWQSYSGETARHARTRAPFVSGLGEGRHGS